VISAVTPQAAPSRRALRKAIARSGSEKKRHRSHGARASVRCPLSPPAATREGKGAGGDAPHAFQGVGATRSGSLIFQW